MTMQLVYKRKAQVLNNSLIRASSKEKKEKEEKDKDKEEKGESVGLRDSLLHCLNKIKVHLF